MKHKTDFMFPTIIIPKLHNGYSTWIKELNYCKEEIRLFENNLEELTVRQTAIRIRAKVEQYQNQFIRQKEVIDELEHKLNISEKQLAVW